MRILNAQNTQILQENRHKENRAKIEHMATHGYASVIVEGHKVYLISDEDIDDERVITVEVEGL